MARIEQEINGKTRLLAILGSNIGYSLSPAIHNFSANLLGQNHVYIPIDAAVGDVKCFCDLFWSVGGIGFNVTTPHKELVAKLIPGHKLASVNTVYRGKDGWMATSTDADGLAAAVGHLGVSFKSFRRFIILGSGGVVSAILNYIATHFEFIPEVSVLRRNPDRDSQIMAGLPSNFRANFVEFRPEVFTSLVDGGAGEAVVIQATNAPHMGDNLARFAVGIRRFNGVYIDLVYGADSAMLKAAKERGLPCQDGLPMLIEQARVAQKLWWGKAAPYNAILSFLSGDASPKIDD